VPWLEEKRLADSTPLGAKDDESGANSIWPEGKGCFTPAAPRRIERIPCKSSLPKFLNNQLLDRPRLARGHEVSYVIGRLEEYLSQQ
jgi:hypothetical protein